ncbi:MAG: heavy metal translocating P-type ATPase [Acutalibacteraceae bacterium]
MKEYKYILNGLNCANCAAKIENAVINTEGIESASLNFANKSISFKSEESNEEKVCAWLQKLVDSIESGVEVTCSGDNKQKKKSFSGIVRIILSVVLFAAGLSVFICLPQYILLSAVLFAGSAIVSCYNVFVKGIISGVKLRPDENTLLFIAVVAAFCIGEYFEAALVALLFAIGEILEEKAVESSRRDIAKLAEIRPDTANLQTENGEQKVAAESVKVNDIIYVNPFERVPLDGIITEGISTLNACAITGESLPQTAQTGVRVMSGMLNGEGRITVRVEKTYENSAASRILKMVEEASAVKGTSEKMITRFARIYTPVVMLLALIVAVLPPLFGLGEFTLWLSRALVFLVAACPCAIVISVPLGFYSGIGGASKLGVLIKGGKYVEALAKADTFVFDKTGTLTTGNLTVTSVKAFGSYTEKEAALLAAAVERLSEHPVASAIKKYAENEALPVLTDYKEIAGVGVSAMLNGKKVMCGSSRILQNTDGKENNGVLYLTVDGALAAEITVEDKVRGESPEVIGKLHKLGVGKTAMLTGDNEKTAEKIANICKVSTFYASLMPQDKVERMNELKKGAKAAVFVGDGINDSPVIAASDCGIAMGLGSQAAIEAADAVLTAGNLKQLPNAVRYCRKIMSTVKANMAFALLVKLVILVLAVFGIAPMWLAVFADTGVSVLCVLNSARLLHPVNDKLLDIA